MERRSHGSHLHQMEWRHETHRLQMKSKQLFAELKASNEELCKLLESMMRKTNSHKPIPSLDSTQQSNARINEDEVIEVDSDSKMVESNVSCEDVHELSNDEGEAEVDQEILSEEEPDDEEIEAPGEHVLVSKEALDVQIHVGEEEQPNNIFYTKLDVEDKVCSVVIDGGSCTNVVSVKEKLVLTILKHPKSYRLHWLNDSGVVKTTKLREEGFVFDPGIDDSDLRTNPSQEEGNDVSMTEQQLNFKMDWAKWLISLKFMG